MDRRLNAKNRIDRYIDPKIDPDKMPVIEDRDRQIMALDRTPEERFDALGVTADELRVLCAELVAEFHQEPYQGDVMIEGQSVFIEQPGFDLAITPDQIAALETVGQLYDILDIQLAG